MKDPLNNVASSYDILEVGLDADKNAIIAAFRNALALRKHDQQRIANARKTLLNPELRIQEDFFFYESEDEKEIEVKVSKKGRDKTLFDNDDITLIKGFDNLDAQLLQEEV